VTKDAMEAVDAAARSAADAANKATNKASSAANQAISNAKGLAQDLGSRIDAAGHNITKQANSLARDAGLVKAPVVESGPSNEQIVAGVVAGVLVVGAAYYLYQEYKKKQA
jgi:hypothetical protein